MVDGEFNNNNTTFYLLSCTNSDWYRYSTNTQGCVCLWDSVVITLSPLKSVARADAGFWSGEGAIIEL
jgi:hypothetical protein